jgi:hypothetical protein
MPWMKVRHDSMMCTISKKKVVYKRFLVFALQGPAAVSVNRTQRAVAHVDSTNSNECPCCTSNKVSYAMDVKFSNAFEWRYSPRPVFGCMSSLPCACVSRLACVDGVCCCGPCACVSSSQSSRSLSATVVLVLCCLRKMKYLGASLPEP